MIAALNPTLGAQIEAPGPDPVLALIEEHRAAHEAWSPLSEAWNSLLLTDPAYAAAEEAERGPGDRVRAALDALTAARPTTLPGVLALAEYLPDAIRRVSTLDGGTEGERALRSIAAALRDLVPPAAPSADLLAMVEEWRDLGRRLGADPTEDGAFERLSAQHTALQFAIYRFPAASVADLAAKVPVLRDEMGDPADASPTGDPADTLAGSAWLGLFRDLEHLNGGLAAPTQIETPDPVLAAIAASRKAQAEMEDFITETKAYPTLGPADREREGVLSAAQIGTDDAVWRTVPTTQAGRRALVDYARFQARVRTAPDGYVDDAEGLIEQILTAFSASIAAEPAIPAQDPDEARALALVDAIERAWAQDACRSRLDRHDAGPEADARHEAMLRHRDELIDEAERTSALNHAGRHAKALALAWIQHEDLWRHGWPRSRYAVDSRLAVDIETSLAVQAGAGDRA